MRKAILLFFPSHQSRWSLRVSALLLLNHCMDPARAITRSCITRSTARAPAIILSWFNPGRGGSPCGIRTPYPCGTVIHDHRNGKNCSYIAGSYSSYQQYLKCENG